MTAWDLSGGTFFQAKGQGQKVYQIHSVNIHKNTATIRRIGGHGEVAGAFREVNRSALMGMIERILETPKGEK